MRPRACAGDRTRKPGRLTPIVSSSTFVRWILLFPHHDKLVLPLHYRKAPTLRISSGASSRGLTPRVDQAGPARGRDAGRHCGGSGAHAWTPRRLEEMVVLALVQDGNRPVGHQGGTTRRFPKKTRSTASSAARFTSLLKGMSYLGPRTEPWDLGLEAWQEDLCCFKAVSWT